MATRKQKHQAALERRERYLRELQRSNLEFLQKEREHRDRKKRELWSPKHNEKHSWKKIDPDCPFCKDMLAEQKHQQRQLEAASNGR